MPSDPDALNNGIVSLVGHIGKLEPGHLAELRRDTPEHGTATFWRLWHLHVQEKLGGDEAGWELAMRAIAILTPTGRDENKRSPHDAGTSFGKALYQAKVSDQRVSRLLSATPKQRNEDLLRITRRLTREGIAFDIRHLVRLILNMGKDDAEQDKRRLARDYYAAEAASENKDGSPS